MKKVIYSAIIGNYDKVNEPKIKTDGWDYILVTNNTDIKSDIWNVKYIDSDNDPKVARNIKIKPWDFIGEYDLYLWVDGNLTINCNLDSFVQQYMHPSADLSIMKHPYRNCIYAEADECKRQNKDSYDIIDDQMAKYRKQKYPLNNGLVQTGVHIKKPTDKVKAHADLWFDEVKKHSKRDQLSFNYAHWKRPFTYNLFSGQILWNEFPIKQHNHGW